MFPFIHTLWKPTETADLGSGSSRTLDRQLGSWHRTTYVLCIWVTVVYLGLLWGTYQWDQYLADMHDLALWNQFPIVPNAWFNLDAVEQA